MMRFGPERLILFHTPDPNELGINLTHCPDDGYVRIEAIPNNAHADGRSSPASSAGGGGTGGGGGGGIGRTMGVIEGKIQEGDVVLEAAGVNMRHPISGHMWKLTVGLMKVSPRPFEVVVAEEMAVGNEEEASDDVVNVISHTGSYYQLDTTNAGAALHQLPGEDSPPPHPAVRNPFQDVDRFGPERTITFHTESLGIKLHRSPTEGIVHILHVAPYKPFGESNAKGPREGPDDGHLEAGDTILEVGGVDLRGKVIGTLEWADMVYFIKQVGRPLEIVVAKDKLFTRERAGVAAERASVAVVTAAAASLLDDEKVDGEAEEEERESNDGTTAEEHENVQPNVSTPKQEKPESMSQMEQSLRSGIHDMAMTTGGIIVSGMTALGLDAEEEIGEQRLTSSKEETAADGDAKNEEARETEEEERDAVPNAVCFNVAMDDICNLPAGDICNLEDVCHLPCGGGAPSPITKKADKPWTKKSEEDDNDDAESAVPPSVILGSEPGASAAPFSPTKKDDSWIKKSLNDDDGDSAKSPTGSVSSKGSTTSKPFSRTNPPVGKSVVQHGAIDFSKALVDSGKEKKSVAQLSNMFSPIKHPATATNDPSSVAWHTNLTSPIVSCFKPPGLDEDEQWRGDPAQDLKGLFSPIDASSVRSAGASSVGSAQEKRNDLAQAIVKEKRRSPTDQLEPTPSKEQQKRTTNPTPAKQLEPTPAKQMPKLDPTPGIQTPKVEPTPYGKQGDDESPFRSEAAMDLRDEFKSTAKPSLQRHESRDDDTDQRPLDELEGIKIPKPVKKNHLLFGEWPSSSTQQQPQSPTGSEQGSTVSVEDKSAEKKQPSFTDQGFHAGAFLPSFSDRSFHAGDADSKADSPFVGNVKFPTTASRQHVPQSALFSQAFVVQHQGNDDADDKVRWFQTESPLFVVPHDAVGRANNDGESSSYLQFHSPRMQPPQSDNIPEPDVKAFGPSAFDMDQLETSYDELNETIVYADSLEDIATNNCCGVGDSICENMFEGLVSTVNCGEVESQRQAKEKANKVPSPRRKKLLSRRRKKKKKKNAVYGHLDEDNNDDEEQEAVKGVRNAHIRLAYQNIRGRSTARHANQFALLIEDEMSL